MNHKCKTQNKKNFLKTQIDDYHHSLGVSKDFLGYKKH